MDQLPTLDGLPAAVAEAEPIRRAMLDQLAEQIAAAAGNRPADLIADLTAVYQEIALRQTDAFWWYVNQGRPLGPTCQRHATDDDKARIAALAAHRA
jgi:hypothetical protein